MNLSYKIFESKGACGIWNVRYELYVGCIPEGGNSGFLIELDLKRGGGNCIRSTLRNQLNDKNENH